VDPELYEPERAEYEEMLDRETREDLTARDFGTIGWGPLSHLTPEATAYLLPRLMELAATDAKDAADDLFMMRFINFISSGPASPQFRLLGEGERAVVASFLDYLGRAHGDLIEHECWDEVLAEAVHAWRDV